MKEAGKRLSAWNRRPKQTRGGLHFLLVEAVQIRQMECQLEGTYLLFLLLVFVKEREKELCGLPHAVDDSISLQK